MTEEQGTKNNKNENKVIKKREIIQEPYQQDYENLNVTGRFQND